MPLDSILLFLIIAGLVILVYRWLGLSRVGGLSPPEQLDQDNQKDLHEAKVIQYQNTLGRELNGFRWKGGDQ